MKIYEILSIVFYPTLLSAILAIIFSFYSPTGLGLLNPMESILIGIIFLSILPTAPALYQVARGKVDINVSVRKKRTVFYGFGAAIMFFGAIVFWLTGTKIMFSYSLSLLLVTTAALLVNLKSKISAHTSGIASDATALVYIYGIFLWPVFLLIPFISFIRYKTKAHSLLQLTAGAAAGIIITLIVFGVFYH
jgi:membrane-associated phospholipid phosphatase